VGVGSGNRRRQSNAFSWYKRLGVNAARNFVQSFSSLTAFVTAEQYGQDLNGIPVTNRDQYMAAVASVRTPDGHTPSATQTTYKNPIKFQKFVAAQSSFGGVTSLSDTEAAAVANYAAIGLQSMFVLQSSCNFHQFTTEDSNQPVFWAERWEIYKYAYMVAYWGYTRGVTRFEIYNEPELITCITPNIWLDQMTIRSTAIRDAFNDYNDDFNGDIAPIVFVAPFARFGYPNGLNQLSAQNRYRQFPPDLPPSTQSLWDVVSYHDYGRSGGAMLEAVQTYGFNMASESGGAPIPVCVSEFNSHIARDWDNLGGAVTTDVPLESTRIASEALGIMASGALEMYAFKFSTTASSGFPNSGIVKSGLHWSDSFTFPFNVGDSTRAGEGYRLVAEIAKGNKPLYQVNADNLVDTQHQYYGVDGQDGNYYLYSCSFSTNVITITLDLSQWPVARGAVIIANEVATVRFGEAVANGVEFIAAPATYRYTQSAYSLVRWTVPVGADVQQTTVLPTDDTTLFAGDKSATHLDGREPTLTTAFSTSLTQDGTSVFLLRFDFTGVVASSKVLTATLNLWVKGAGSGSNIMTVMGLPGFLDWDEFSATWNSCPALDPLPNGYNATSIARDWLSWNTTTPNVEVAGHVSYSGIVGLGDDSRSIDVTTHVKQFGPLVTFMVRRPFRNNQHGDVPADDPTNSFLTVYSKDYTADPSKRPSLTLQYRTSDFGSTSRLAKSVEAVTSSATVPLEASAPADGPESGAAAAKAVKAPPASAL